VFGEVVRANRRRLGLTQEELAARAGLAVRGIRKIETGRVGTPRTATVRLLADAFGLMGTDRERFCRTAADAPTHAPTRPYLPAQLPADVSAFTGRDEQLACLDALLAEAGDQPTALILSVLSGTAGVGKTALAVHWSHRVAGRFPDGQLFVDLHGFTEGVAPVEPADALDRLLRALGVPGEQIPVVLEDRAGLWRSALAGRRMLIVLDNAAAEAQVAPLLPGTPGCVVLVTSRRHLAGLESSQTISLNMLPPADAVMLLTRICGKERLASQPAELIAGAVELCGRLPLAIRIAAARLRSHPSWSLADLAGLLRDQDQRLAELDDGSRGVTAALDVSYHQLPADQQRMYRLLGLHPGPDVDVHASAALVEANLAQTRHWLDQLLGAHLLQEPTVGRYVLHDLIRAHATTTARHDEPEPSQKGALTRLSNYYRHTASRAMDAAYPYTRNRRPSVPPADTPDLDLSDPPQANVWLDTELPNLLAVARDATRHGWSEYTLAMSAILGQHLRIRCRHREAETLHHEALAISRMIGDEAGELDAMTGLGWLYKLQGRHQQSINHFTRAAEIARSTANRTGELDALTGLGWVHLRQGWHRHALDHFTHALSAARATGDRVGEQEALRGLGNVHMRQGRYELALDHGQQSLEIARATGNRPGELNSLYGLGNIHMRQGRYDRAHDHYQRALEIARATGNRTGELNSLFGLCHVQRMQRPHEQAHGHYQRALEIARATANRTGELQALVELGHDHRLRGRCERAATSYQQALDLAREISNRNWQFEALHGLGRLHQATGYWDMALSHHQQALMVASDLGQPADQARAHDGLAHAHRALGQPKHARQYWQRALDILTDLGTDYTEEPETNASTIRANLAALDQPRVDSSPAGVILRAPARDRQPEG
jgi:tetratricopeptide (TPR) repeat protein/transcriptional regulator with XRE-family HTH domain